MCVCSRCAVAMVTLFTFVSYIAPTSDMVLNLHIHGRPTRMSCEDNLIRYIVR